VIVLVDTPVWSLALRRKSGDLSASERIATQALADLVREGRAQMIGAARQELLSGVREKHQFQNLREYLSAFEDPDIEAADYEEAARMNNQCRTRGIAGSAIDFLICSVAHRRKWEIFTLDRDFERFGKVLGLTLYKTHKHSAPRSVDSRGGGRYVI
jgi:predicted nucleic acid-binding protein